MKSARLVPVFQRKLHWLDEEDASSTLNMEAVGFSKRLLPTYQTPPCYIPKAPTVH